MSYSARKCACGQCSNWVVSPVADIQGVGFTREQAPRPDIVAMNAYAIADAMLAERERKA